MSKREKTTWDGKPISSELPYGATIVVYRQNQRRLEYLILHRAYNNPSYEGEWAWTPPSGARYPGESVEECAVRELEEETGLVLQTERTSHGTEDWYVYVAEAEETDQIVVGVEHDRYKWVSLEEAVRRCQPEKVSVAIQRTGEWLNRKGSEA
jgi:8-oxo-dGTP pyrophosphatase MutT (NUDIX family)